MEILLESRNYDTLLDLIKIYPAYDLEGFVLYHNTRIYNVKDVLLNGLSTSKATQREFQGEMIWATEESNHQGYGGCTIAFTLDPGMVAEKVNKTEWTIYDDIPPENILFADLPVIDQGRGRLSDIPYIIRQVGAQRTLDVLEKYGYDFFSFEALRHFLQKFSII